MYEQNRTTVRRYLTELVEGGDFTDIPMQDDLHFTGPLVSSTTAMEYRSVCEAFAETVAGLSIRSMVGDADVVHVVYDVDIGLIDGTLATSQTIEFDHGAFASVEVIFDAARVAQVAS